MSGIYVASRFKHAPMWLAMRDAGWSIVSSWIDESSPVGADAWVRFVREAADADAVVAYYEEGDGIWKGAHVEIGAALGQGVPVFLVGPVPDDWSWVNHPLVTHCKSLSEALTTAQHGVVYWADVRARFETLDLGRPPQHLIDRATAAVQRARERQAREEALLAGKIAQDNAPPS